jgi:hypothetical protein
MPGLIDLDELALRCRDEQAKAYVREAVACYSAGAFRACIVSTWNAVVFDFLHKLRELEVTGDKAAKTKLDEFQAIREGGEARLKDALEFERNVLVCAASKFELLTPLEREDLERLQRDRNRCAHPSMQSPEDPYEPTAELARTHIRNAVEIMLEREPVQGKAAFDRICADIKGKYFPADANGAEAHLRNGPLKRARPALIRNLIVGITKSNLKEGLPDDERQRQLAALGAIVAMHRLPAEQVMRTDLPKILAGVPDERLWAVVEYVRHMPLCWEIAGEAQQSRLRLFVSSIDDGSKARSIGHGLCVAELNRRCVERLSKCTDRELIEIIKIAHLPECVPAAITAFAQAGSYRHAELLGKSLILPLLDLFTADQLAQTLDAVPNNSQILYAAEIPDILCQIFDALGCDDADVAAQWRRLFTQLDERFARDPGSSGFYKALRDRGTNAGLIAPPSTATPADSVTVPEGGPGQ